jgi:acyl-CoA thioesterase-1
MSLTEAGKKRVISYETPRAPLLQTGVQRGAVFFVGEQDGRSYRGTAHAFYQGCAPLPYQVEGEISEDKQHLRLQGKRPQADGGCQVRSYQDHVIELKYSRTPKQSAATDVIIVPPSGLPVPPQQKSEKKPEPKTETAAGAAPSTAREVAARRPVKIVALGDSLTSGRGIAAAEAFPVKLEQALRAKGYAVEVINAGVSGDTAAGGLARLDRSVPQGTEAVIVELGANDALRGVDPETTRRALDEILLRLRARGILTLLAGMRAPPNRGPDYVRRFDAIYPDLARRHGVILYPFFLDRVVGDAALNQRDGVHPSAAGIDVIVRGLMPQTEELVSKVLESRKPNG